MQRNALILMACASAVAGLASSGFAKDPVERLTAFAVDMSTTPDARPSGVRSGTVNISIERWSTDEERKRLTGALKEGGPDLLLKQLQKIDDPAGQVYTPGNVGTPLRFAWQSSLPDGGRRIVVATDRRIGFFESAYRLRTMDYPFLVMDIRMNGEGKGEGKLIPAARIEAGEDGTFEVEGYASEPVRLAEVRSEKSR
jgi:hypothetical protein